MISGLDMSQHSHEIGPANLPFTRRGRKAAVQREKERTHNDISSADNTTPAPTMPTNTNAVAGPSSAPQSATIFTQGVSMLTPLPVQPQYQHPPPQTYMYPTAQQAYPPQPVHHPAMSHDRWENMATLFHSIREHARGFEYPTVSMAALETVLIRLYLESPVGLGTQPTMAAIMQNNLNPAGLPPQQQQPLQHANGSAGANSSEGVNGGGAEESN